MKVVLRRLPDTIGQVEIVEIDGKGDALPAGRPYVSEGEALKAASEFTGLSFDRLEAVYEGG